MALLRGDGGREGGIVFLRLFLLVFLATRTNVFTHTGMVLMNEVKKC